MSFFFSFIFSFLSLSLLSLSVVDRKFIQLSLFRVHWFFDYHQYENQLLQDEFLLLPFLLISSILEYVTVIYIEWVGDLISFLFTRANTASILFEARGSTDLSVIRLSGARKSEFARDTNHQLPCLNHNISYCFPRNQFRLKVGRVSSRPCNLLSMKADSLIDPYKISIATLDPSAQGQFLSGV